MPNQHWPASLRLLKQRRGGGQTFRTGDNFFRSSPTCSFSEETVVHVCGLSLKTPVQTRCSASGFIFVMQNCMHISQTCATKTRLRITKNATVLQFKWMHVHVQGTARAAGSFQWRFFFISTWFSWFLLNGCCLVQLSTSSLLCLVRQGKPNYPHDVSCHLALWLTTVRKQTTAAAITALWYNVQKAFMYSRIMLTFHSNHCYELFTHLDKACVGTDYPEWKDERNSELIGVWEEECVRDLCI